MPLQIAVSVGQDPPLSSIDLSASQAVPTCISSWSSSGDDHGPTLNPKLHGVAIGCQDGSVFLYRSSHERSGSNSSRPKLSLPVDSLEPLSRPSSPLRFPGLGKRSVRSSSPSSIMSTIAPLQVSRSRVVSALSPEQAEAPKNYVDFDEEPEKLKGMLKGKGPRDKSALEPDKTLEAVASTPPPETHSRHTPSPLIVTMSSDTSSPRSSASSSSPHWTASQPAKLYGEQSSLSLVSHVFQRNHSPNPAVVFIQAVYHGRMIACLREDGCIQLISTEDGCCFASFVPEEPSVNPNTHIIWTWKALTVLKAEEYFVVFAIASPTITTSNIAGGESTDGDDEDQTRLVAIEFRDTLKLQYDQTSCAKIGDWIISGPAEGVALHHTPGGRVEIVHITSASHIIRQPLDIVAYPPEPDVDASKSQSSVHLPIPNPFKALTNKSVESLGLLSEDRDKPIRPFDRVLLGREGDFGALALHNRVNGIQLQSTASGLRGLVWSDTELSGFECGGDSLRNIFSVPVESVKDVRWKDQETYILLFSDRAEEYSLIDVDANNDSVGRRIAEENIFRNIQPRMTHSVTLLSSDAYTITPSMDIITTRIKRGKRRIEHTSLELNGNPTSSTIFRGYSGSPSGHDSDPRISSVLPLDLDHIIVGLSDGSLRRVSYSDLIRLQGTIPPQPAEELSWRLSGKVTSLHLVRDPRTTDTFILGGSDDGGIGIWSLENMKLLARWVIFTSLLIAVVPVMQGRLRGCAFCIAHDGTIAVIAVDEPQFLFLIPASMAPLTHIYAGEDSLLVCYADGRARLWDLKTREHWRTMTLEKTEEMVKSGGWNTWRFGDTEYSSFKALSSLSGGSHCPDSAATVVIDVEAFLAQVAATNQTVTSMNPNTEAADFVAENASHIRSMLAALLTRGMNHDIDRICHDILKIPAASTILGSVSTASVSLNPVQDASSAWKISAEVSAGRALSTVSMLHALTQHLGDPNDVDTVIAFYTVALPAIIGSQYKAPDLSILAQHWLRTPTNVVRTAAKALFDSGVARLSDEETTQLVDLWQSSLPASRATEKEHIRSALALFICGSVAVGNYALLSTSYLTLIAKSVTLYLHDETSPYRALAIELCSRGFPIWQQYVDAVQMLRALFTLSTSTRKEGITIQNVGLLARNAVLQIASTNSPLFMTTLSLDILNPGSIQHRKSVMQLVIFLIRKKPLVLYSNLPRLVEAVVKSLDPNASANRDAILDSATEILSHIVQSFPTVDFHMGSQRLAVGTSEGSVVMYDLKTATRLYVLEGHKKRTTACSFSPDGRRLVTVSLDESAVLVWKIGSSFSSFFNPGAPPRQGHSGTEPFKTLSFNVGDEAHMSLESTFELVRFEWASDRSVKLKIRESVLTFST